ncbi:hypothetical protein FDP41_010611 [Naegleria fowleri]|uniref:Ras-GEF domain-containing protein n=1 Tax=Naegleria fowleri TaxID=5763 RepID=A0A6A5C718_NAEFO|nr:uncharacterized protein FDP41_010611 [Naegleria fowleri]KAF0983546.1 hypothetical protein FDP41_010611 [Naegleria fowleri]
MIEMEKDSEDERHHTEEINLQQMKDQRVIKKKMLLHLFEKYLREHHLHQSASVLIEEMKKLDSVWKNNDRLNSEMALLSTSSNLNHEWSCCMNEMNGIHSPNEQRAREDFTYLRTVENNTLFEEEMIRIVEECDLDSLLHDSLWQRDFSNLNSSPSLPNNVNNLELSLEEPEHLETVLKYISECVASRSEKPLDKLCLMYQNLGISSFELLACIQHLTENTSSCKHEISTTMPCEDFFENTASASFLLLKLWLSKYYLKYSQFEISGKYNHKKVIDETLRFLYGACSCKWKESLMKWILYESANESHSTIMIHLEQVLMKNITSKQSRSFSRTLLSILDIDVKVMTTHLSYIFGKYFLAIEPQELIGANWTKSRRKYLSPNILDNIDIFNHYSTWFASLVVQENEKSMRVQVLEYLISLASCCHRVGNFYAVYVIASALSSGPVGRLKQTFNALSTESEIEYERIRTLTSSDMNSANYTKALKEVFSRASENPSQYCCIPNLGKHLGELTLTEESVQDIDFKMDVIYELISSKILDLQRVLLQSMTSLKLDCDVLAFVLETKGIYANTDEMMLLSKQYEINTPMRSKTLSSLTSPKLK